MQRDGGEGIRTSPIRGFDEAHKPRRSRREMWKRAMGWSRTDVERGVGE
jgi:hypothetical protein